MFRQSRNLVMVMKAPICLARVQWAFVEAAVCAADLRGPLWLIEFQRTNEYCLTLLFERGTSGLSRRHRYQRNPFSDVGVFPLKRLGSLLI